MFIPSRPLVTQSKRRFTETCPEVQRTLGSEDVGICEGGRGTEVILSWLHSKTISRKGLP